MATTKWTVPIKRTILDVYVVDANSVTEAGMAAQRAITKGDKPHRSDEVGFRVLTASKMKDDADTDTAVNDASAAAFKED